MTKFGKWVSEWTRSANPWTNVYGLGRTLLAMGTVLTLAFNNATILFRPAAGLPTAPFCSEVSRSSIFCLLGPNRLDLARWVAVILLLIVASGWRPRITALLHWWISFSLQSSAVTIDGGDQVTAVLALLLLPVALTDSRVWHWQRSIESSPRLRSIQRFIGLSALAAIRVQVAGIYFHAAIGKFGAQEWVDGTALYYWLTDPTFGASGWILTILQPVLTHAASVAVFTWGVMLLELFLAAGLIATRRARSVLLLLGVSLHLSIALVQGLVSFAFAMVAALVLYLRPTEEEFAFAVVPSPKRKLVNRDALCYPARP